MDLGVRVPAARILDPARSEQCDAIGLSGLITPSLEEMVGVAKEMQRQGFRLPLLIGGATTSSQHTAVKIAPAYERPTVHVQDASRVVGVMASVLDGEKLPEFDRKNRASQERLRLAHAARSERPLIPLAHARAQAGARARAAPRARALRPAARRAAARGARRVHRLDLLLHRVGAEGPLPGVAEPSGARTGRARALRERPGAPAQA